jgi:hypothetical protein
VVDRAAAVAVPPNSPEFPIVADHLNEVARLRRTGSTTVCRKNEPNRTHCDTPKMLALKAKRGSGAKVV